MNCATSLSLLLESTCILENWSSGWMRHVNLLCWCSQGRLPKGKWAVAVQPASKGKNIHIIGAIAVVQMTCMCGAFSAEAAKAWVQNMLNNILVGLTVDNMGLVCDNASCHSKLEELTEENDGSMVFKLGPYSPQLNPLENIWSVKDEGSCKERHEGS